MDAASIGGFLFVVVVSGAVLLPATLGSIVTELSGATNLGVEGLMLFGAMVAYGTAFTTGDAMLGAAAGTLAGGILSLTHAIPVVYGRMTQERQLVLGLILVYLGDALSRLLGAPYISKASKALDVRWTVPYLADLPVVGEALFRQYGLVYVTYGLALALWFVLYRTRAGPSPPTRPPWPPAAATAAALATYTITAAINIMEAISSCCRSRPSPLPRPSSRLPALLLATMPWLPLQLGNTPAATFTADASGGHCHDRHRLCSDHDAGHHCHHCPRLPSQRPHRLCRDTDASR